MPNTGDNYITTLKRAHLEWGSHRYTLTRPGLIYGEGYLQIPAKVAYNFNITNNSSPLRTAEYTFSTSDGFIINGKLLASGTQSRPEFAKQFQGSGNLKLLGDWYHHIGAVVGRQIKIEFTSPTEIHLTAL